MEKASKYHIDIKSDTGTKLKFTKPKKESDTLPSHIGHIFKSAHEIKEEMEYRKTFKDFLK